MSSSDANTILNALDALDSKLGPGGRKTSNEAATPYLAAAAVLHVFNPEDLQASGQPTRNKQVMSSLFAASAPAEGWLHNETNCATDAIESTAASGPRPSGIGSFPCHL